MLALPKHHDTLVGIDSDGCVFDTMTVKQREHFFPAIIRHWGLEACAGALCACAEFVNLQSKTRGSNRFPALLRVFELLRDYPGVRESGVTLPATDALRAYVHSGLPLGNPSLKEEVARTQDPELARVLDWSLKLNADIDARMRPVPPFGGAVRALAMIHASSDALVVSQTPEAALIKEWDLHGLTGYVSLIAGQEKGSKAEHLRLASDGRYPLDHILLIGDAQGDLAAARAAGVLFYPIGPGAEERAWERFCDEAYPRFLAGTYAGAYEQGLIAAFEALLPDTPPWLSAFHCQVLDPEKNESCH
ncbi:MAG TPA: HAD family hydrolase [Kiritimatiellia bacterium]|nr:HAD family hydrolase [Kiritimatiellia bacterium]HRU70438.1 HAD family hydrolase [Kiritimatiellia bacterium]